MKKVIQVLSILLILFALDSLSRSAQAQKGFTYKTAKIGKQVWMTENLNEDAFRNGDSIPEARVNSNYEWYFTGEEGKPAWCYYEDEPDNGDKYGKLYNWYAISDPRGLCPDGWHIPSDDEWKEMEIALGMSQNDADDIDYNQWRGTDEGSKLKAKHDWAGGTENTNKSGFSALPGSSYTSNMGFGGLGDEAIFWTSTGYADDRAWCRILYSHSTQVVREMKFKNAGFSVRCIKDSK